MNAPRMPPTLRLAPLALALAAACGRGAPPATPSPEADIARVTTTLRAPVRLAGTPPVAYALADRMAHYKVPGVSIAVVQDGRIAWARGFGVREAGTRDSVTAETVFQAASISKPVTATAMLRLVEAGRLDLDAPVNTYLTSWRLPDSRFTAHEPVTLRRIVAHNAGLTVHGFPGYAQGAPVPTVPQLLDGAAPANTRAVRVDTTPGAITRYSGGGTTIEQLVLTDVTGEPFPALLQRLVLAPAGMAASGYLQPLPPERHARAAAGHAIDGTMIPGRWHTYPELAAAGLWTTPSDLMRWALAVAASRDSAPGALLRPATARHMLAEHAAGGFGLGPQVQGTGDGFWFGHGGANEGYRAQVVYFPARRTGAAVMTNSDAGSALIDEILFAIAETYGWVGRAPREVTVATTDSAALDAHVGTYAGADPPGVRLHVTRQGTRTFVEVPGFVARGEVVFTAAHEATSLETGNVVTFGTDAAGRVDRVSLGGTVLRRLGR